MLFKILTVTDALPVSVEGQFSVVATAHSPKAFKVLVALNDPVAPEQPVAPVVPPVEAPVEVPPADTPVEEPVVPVVEPVVAPEQPAA